MLDKKGTPEQIQRVSVINDRQFDKLYMDICKENKLIRCPGCGKLISKRSEDGSKTIQHRGLKAIIREGEVILNCVHCGRALDFK